MNEISPYYSKSQANGGCSVHAGPAHTGCHCSGDGRGWHEREGILEAYPDLEKEDIKEALEYAAESVRERELPLVEPH